MADWRFSSEFYCGRPLKEIGSGASPGVIKDTLGIVHSKTEEGMIVQAGQTSEGDLFGEIKDPSGKHGYRLMPDQKIYAIDNPKTPLADEAKKLELQKNFSDLLRRCQKPSV